MHDVDLVADGAFEFPLIYITFAASSSEVLQTVSTSTLRAVAAFVKIVFDHETKLALEILRDGVNLIIRVDI